MSLVCKYTPDCISILLSSVCVICSLDEVEADRWAATLKNNQVTAWIMERKSDEITNKRKKPHCNSRYC